MTILRDVTRRNTMNDHQELNKGKRKKKTLI